MDEPTSNDISVATHSNDLFLSSLVRSPLTNIIKTSEFLASKKELFIYLKELAIADLPEDYFDWSFVSKYEEFRPTEYVQNSRHIHTLVFASSAANTQLSYSFDVTGII